MTDPELVRRVAEATTGRTVCRECAEVFLAILDAVRSTSGNQHSDEGH